MKPFVKMIFVLVLLAAAAAAGVWLASTVFKPKPTLPVALERGTPLNPPREIPEFSLVSHTGTALRRADLAGRRSLMFFGFTHCPGVCPMTLAILSDVTRRLASLPATEQPRIAFVSVDPERDTPAVMAHYIQSFKAPMLGITGEPAAIDAFAAAMGIAHGKIPMEGGDYMVDHTSVVILLDEQARQAAVFSEPFDAAAIANDYLRLSGRTPAQPSPLP